MLSSEWLIRPGTRSARKSRAQPGGKPAGWSLRSPVTRSFRSSPRCWHRCRHSPTVNPRRCVHARPLSIHHTNHRHIHPLWSAHTYILWPVVYTRPSYIVVALMHGCPFAIIVQSHGMDSRERGMMIHTWNSPDPLSISMFNVNYSQTRHTRAACCCVAHTHRVHVYHLIPA